MMLILHAPLVMLPKQNYTAGQELELAKAKLPLPLYHLLHGEVLLFAYSTKLLLTPHQLLLVHVLLEHRINVTHVTVLQQESVLLLNSSFLLLLLLLLVLNQLLDLQ
jgi:hypothetical protein